MIKTVVVTGASTGIGFDAVRLLTEKGIHTIATVRRTEDATKLKKFFGSNVTPVLLDMSSLEAIESFPLILRKEFGITAIDGLVNNAGSAMTGPFLNQDFREIAEMVQVNLLGMMKLTQVLLPMLGAQANAAHQGRIINIGSTAGKLTSPFLIGYAVTKHGVEAFTDGLRRELALFDIPVILIGPGPIKTPIWIKAFEVVKEKYRHTLYASSFDKFIALGFAKEKHALPVASVSDMIFHALTSQTPKLRYTPIPGKFENWDLPMLMPVKMLDRIIAKKFGLYKVGSIESTSRASH